MKTKKMETARARARREARKQNKVTGNPNFSKLIGTANADFIIWAIDRQTGHTSMLPVKTKTLIELYEIQKADGYSLQDSCDMLNETLNRPEVRTAVRKELYGMHDDTESVAMEIKDFRTPMAEFAIALESWVAYITLSKNALRGGQNFAVISFDLDSSNHATFYGTCVCDNLEEAQVFGWYAFTEMFEMLPKDQYKELFGQLGKPITDNLLGIMDLRKKYR